MNIMVVDDKALAVNALCRILRDVAPESSCSTAGSASDALELAKRTRFDVVFLDIEMPYMNGLELAKKLKETNESVNIIFVTAHGEHALEAHSLYVSGFLLKPASENDVRDALSNLRNPVEPDHERLKVRCFGDFDVFYKNEPLKFDRTKTKELLAYLVHRRGSRCTTSELLTVLWEDASNSTSRRTQVRNLIHDLRTTLASIGQTDVLVRERDNVAVRTSELDCDLYRFLNNDPEVENLYHGEYMAQYAWADVTESIL